MKKIAIFAVCLLVLAATIRAIAEGAGFGPTVLTLSVETPDGTDVTRQVRIIVGAVAGEDLRAPTLGNISVIKPKERASHRYDVPYDRETAVFVIVKNQPAQQFGFRLKGGSERSETIVLETHAALQ